MLTLITGAPGTGKSNAVVSLMGELLGKDGRQVYVDGIPELKIPHEPLKDACNWHNDVPDGSCIVIDEVQRVWRPRGPGQKVPDHIAMLETHRHRGLDFYVITQAPALVDTNVRALVGRHVHLRDLGVLGRWWYEWPECNPQCATAWKNAPIKKRYRLDSKVQAQYKSASIHVKPVRSLPWMLVVMMIALLVVGFLAWKSYTMIQAKMHPPAPPVPAVSTKAGPPGAAAPAGGASVASSAPKFIDDRVDWIPRVSSRPESAPAFDQLRQVVAMPRIVGGMVMGKRVRCVTQQGTDAGVSEVECRAWLANPPFDPYAAPEAKGSRDEARGHRDKSADVPGGSVVIPEAAKLQPSPSAPQQSAQSGPGRRPM